MLVKRDDDTLGQLLERLDAAIHRAVEDGEFTDEINRRV
jgi:ribosome assembly protein YihI (activator of Der GTPase)